jgi:hypothetical protein
VAHTTERTSRRFRTIAARGPSIGGHDDLLACQNSDTEKFIPTRKTPLRSRQLDFMQVPCSSRTNDGFCEHGTRAEGQVLRGTHLLKVESVNASTAVTTD